MKKIFVIAALVIGSGPIIIDPVFSAEREDTICRSTDVVDGGYILTIRADQKTANLDEQTIAGPRPLISLECKKLPTQLFPDALNNTLICKDTRDARDSRAPGRLIVRRYVGGIAGFDYASVREVTNLGEQQIEKEIEYGRLNCRH
jgi:hypothetical protein